MDPWGKDARLLQRLQMSAEGKGKLREFHFPTELVRREGAPGILTTVPAPAASGPGPC